MEGKPFSVIKFLTDNSVDYVPTKWIKFEEQGATVKFPKLKNSKSAKLQNDPESNPKNVWPEWNIKVKKSYDTAEEAEKKAQQYSQSSDIESSSQESVSRSKKRKFETSCPSIPVPTSTVFNLNRPYESSPPENVGPLNSMATLTTQAIPIFQSNLATLTDNPNLDQPLPYLFEVEHADGTQPESNVSVVLNSISQPLPSSSGSSLHYLTSQPVNNTMEVLLRETRAFHEKSLLNDAIIIQEQQQIKKYLLKLTTGEKSSETLEEGPYSFIPLRSTETLRGLNDELNAIEKFDNFVSALTRFGRTEVSKSIGDILSYLFEPQFSKTVRYTDASGKLPLKDTVLIKAVREAAIRIHVEAKVKQINQAIAVWFRGSGDRGGGRIRRHGDKKNNKKTGSEVNASSITENTSEPGADGCQTTDGNFTANTTE